jgi:hypothetical protein
MSVLCLDFIMFPYLGYFVDHKRGEVNELKGLLRNPKITKEPAKMRDVIKKVCS